MPIARQYFDQTEFEAHPIKFQINNDNDIFPHPELSLNYYFKVSENHVTLSDSLLGSLFPSSAHDFIDIRSFWSPIGMPDPAQFMPLIAVIFLLDENASTTERKVVTIADALSKTGGLMGIIFSLVSVLVTYVESQLFISSLMKKMFYYLPELYNHKKLDKQKNANLRRRMTLMPTFNNDVTVQDMSMISEGNQNMNSNNTNEINNTIENS